MQTYAKIKRIFWTVSGLLLPLIFTFSCKQVSSSQELSTFNHLEVIKGYTIFETEGQLAEWYEGYRPTLSAMEGADTGEMIKMSPRENRYLEINRMIAELWTAYQELYAEQVQGVPPPKAILLQNKKKSAFATYDRSKKLAPNAIFIYSGVIEGNFKNKDAVLGVIAHELAHHVLQHLVPGVSEKIKKYYIANSKEPIGARESPNQQIKTNTESWLEAAQMVGPYSVPELKGIPVPTIGTPFLKIMAQMLAEKYTDREACKKMKTAIGAAEEVISKKMDGATQEMQRPGPMDALILKAAGQSYNEELKVCLAGESLSIIEFLASIQHRSIEDVLKETHLQAEELTAIKKQGNTSEALIEFANLMSSRIEKLNKMHDFSKVRIYGTEDQADDTAIEVLIKLNKSSSPLIQFFESQIPDAQLRDCKNTIRLGKTPAYGTLLDEHHSNCFRIYHAGKIEEFLKNKKVLRISDQG